MNARLPFTTVVDYSAAKAALTNLTKSMSEEFAPRGVRVNSVAPGPVRTPFWTAPGGFADTTAAAAGTTAQEAIDVVIPKSMGITTGRFTEPQEVADLVVFLASPPWRATSPAPSSSSTAARPRPPDRRARTAWAPGRECVGRRGRPSRAVTHRCSGCRPAATDKVDHTLKIADADGSGIEEP
ncbi:SDR family NAD(P)-dependent oxidoreductase [Streptomyces sp. NPDC058391]|uniref:SDR family NAD(P)-dependent oxidoreductase n=1 Tax=Streptomyces sp. NPDC058391 TaxID=3346476 RepID=UPI003659C9A2